MVAPVYAATQSAGQCTAIPDVCKTPSPSGPTPVPYPNIGVCAQAVATALKVKIVMMPVIHNLSQIPLSNGNEAGTLGGVRSSVFKGPVTYAVGSSKVFIEGKPCEFQTAATRHNGTPFNSNGMQDIASQSKVLVAR